MAEIIPDRLPSRASAGEKKLFSVLQRLPDDYIVYYESIFEDRYPDFVVICPDLGLLVITVKGWYPRDIITVDSNTVVVTKSREQVRHTHPNQQASEYLSSLIDECRKHPTSQRLLQKKGESQNKFLFPFGHFVVLSNITSAQLKSHSNGDLTPFFPPGTVVTRDQLENWTDETISPGQLGDILISFFAPFWEINKLTDSQVNTLRAIIHPEIIVNETTGQDNNSKTEEQEDLQEDLKVLDFKQEKHALNIGEGHRIIYGVAGSGKTVILIAKARLLSSQKPDARILLLCYNLPLAAYLKEKLKDYQNINVLHFDGWARANGVVREWQNRESDEELGNRLLQVLEEGEGDSRIYDAVMIDEAQDFEVSWFKCALEAMQDPDDGDLIIVGDGSQGLYSRRRFTWRDIGINAKGRTIHAKFDLDKNYRNSREIVELAAVFSSPSKGDEEDSILALQVSPDKCKRKTGFKPVLVESKNKAEELTKVLRIIENLLQGQWFGREISPLEPKDIAIFYPLVLKRDRELLRSFVNDLQLIAPTVWLSDPENPRARTKVSELGIKVQTIHSAKGLQYRAVILIWADSLPIPFGDVDEAKDRRLFYVGLTRPEDFLVISASASSKFVTEIQNSGKVDLHNLIPEISFDSIEPNDQDLSDVPF